MSDQKLVIKKDDIIYISIFLWSLTDLLAYSTFLGDYEIIKVVAYVFARVLLRVVCILSILTSGYSPADAVKSVLIIILAEVTNHNATTRIFIPLMYVMAAGKYIDEKRIVKYILASNVIAFLTTSILSLVGLLPVKLFLPSIGAYRYSLGFRTANTGPIILFQIAAAMWIVSPKKNRSALFTFLAFCISFFLCNSRTASILTLALFFAEIIWWITVNQRSILFQGFVWRILYFVGIGAALIILISVGIASNRLDASSYNELFSGRFMLMQRYFSYYKVTLFGQKLMFGSNAYQYGLSTLDNAYVHMLLAYGLVLSILFFYYFVRVVVRSIKGHENQKLIILILYALYGFAETVGVRFLYNFSLIYFNEVLWNKSTIVDEDSEEIA